MDLERTDLTGGVVVGLLLVALVLTVAGVVTVSRSSTARVGDDR